MVLIPLTYNDGSRVAQEILDEIFEELFVLSGGHTSTGTVRGAYRMQDGSKQTDLLEQVWVAYEEADRSALAKNLWRDSAPCSAKRQCTWSLLTRSSS